MIQIIHAEKRHFADHGWLKTHYLFSFADYYDSQNLQFGAIRVFNDDVVAGGAGFPPPQHAEMEIVTIVLDGEITHQDSTGTKETVKAGEVQAMTAGTGVVHSEYNLGGEPLHLYQIWIRPSKAGLAPSYGQVKFAPSDWKNKFLAVASGQGKKGAAKINADATIYRCALDKGKKLAHDSGGRRALIYLTDGALEINGAKLGQNGQARIEGEASVEITAEKNSHFILIDVPG